LKTGTKVIAAKTQTNPYPNDSLTKIYTRATKLITEQTGITKGYCLVLDNGWGRLAYELARKTDLKIVGTEKDSGQVTAARNALDKAGLYGRVVVHQKDSAKLPYTQYFANLITSDEVLRTGELPSAPDEVFKVLRPYGGTVALVLPADKFNRQKLKTWGQPFLTDWNILNMGEIVMAWARRTELEGAGEWTHIYAEPGNAACSQDTIVKPGYNRQGRYGCPVVRQARA
jgi:hypothetical protein